MPRQDSGRGTENRQPLTADRIVDAALVLIGTDGLDRLSMRRLGTALGVDPMAVYHHLPSKRAVLSEVLERVLSGLTPPDPNAAWDEQARQWVARYRKLIVAHPEIIRAAIIDPTMSEAVAERATAPLRAAIEGAGIVDDVDGCVDVIVDFVNGATLVHGSAQTQTTAADRSRLARSFDTGLEIILAGIRSRSVVLDSPVSPRRSRTRSPIPHRSRP